MTIEVQARLVRGPVYLAGETLECFITFRCQNAIPTGAATAKGAAYASSTARFEEETLAWAGAEIHCQCTVDESKVKYPCKAAQDDKAISSRDTSFQPCQGERGYVVLATKPKILFCDLKLMPGESKTYIYRETIPSDAPPSYSGQAVKYAYKVTIGTQRVNSVIQNLRIPIRVLVLTGFSEALIPTESDDLQVAPANPFLADSQQKESVLDIALHQLDSITARRNPSHYIVTNQNGKVVRFCLLKAAFRLGEDVVGTFDFSEATVSCVQFSVTLQTEEEVKEDCRVRPKQNVSTVSYSKHHEFCLHMRHTQMILPIPLTVTPMFHTNIVSLSWKLHFEFVTTTTPLDRQHSGQGNNENEQQQPMWQGPPNLDIQTMVWDLPIKVYPTHPVQVSNGLQAQTSNSLQL